MSDNKEDKKTKEEYVLDYIRGFDAIEQELEPYRDQKRALKENYKENGWLSKEELSMAVKAYRMVKGETDLIELTKYYDTLKRSRKV